jgi:hypothetical protein
MKRSRHFETLVECQQHLGKVNYLSMSIISCPQGGYRLTWTPVYLRCTSGPSFQHADDFTVGEVYECKREIQGYYLIRNNAKSVQKVNVENMTLRGYAFELVS